MKAYLTRRYCFSASHRLHNDNFSPEDNARIYGKCNNPHGHGHNYGLEVTVSGAIHPQTGMVCNIAELDAFIEQHILERFGHEHLNCLPEFTDQVPTSENIAREMFNILRRGFHAAHLEKVRLEETNQNFFEYAGGGQPRQ